MKGNRNDGIGLSTAVCKLSNLWKGVKQIEPFFHESHWDDEFQRIFRQMRKRVKMNKGGRE